MPSWTRWILAGGRGCWARSRRPFTLLPPDEIDAGMLAEASLPVVFVRDWRSGDVVSPIGQIDQPRAEYIRVQCALASPPDDDPSCPYLRNREWRGPSTPVVAGPILISI